VLAGTTFNGQAVVGANAGDQIFQVGANTTASDIVTVTTQDFSVNTDITDVTTGNLTGDATALATVIDNIDTALDTVNGERATYGAVQNRFDAIISNLMVAHENQTAARSRIMDADFAVETAKSEPRADPAAGRQRHDCAGQLAAPGCADPAAQLRDGGSSARFLIDRGKRRTPRICAIGPHMRDRSRKGVRRCRRSSTPTSLR
jgi:hypothetical protein